MAETIAYVYGTALTPGVSKNKRLYTAKMIESAVRRAQSRIGSGAPMVARDLDALAAADPLSSLTHHAANDDSEKIAGRVDALTFDQATGSARYKLAVPNTEAGRTMVALTDTSDGQPPFLRGMSIRGAWLGPTRRVTMPDGETAETAGDDALELDGLDFTRKPGVAGALIDKVERVGARTTESAAERTPIFESAEARVEIVEALAEAAKHTASDNMVPGCDGTCCDDCGVNAGKSGTDESAPVSEAAPTTAQRKSGADGPYADPGYQADGLKRYQLSTAAKVRAAWSYINQSDNAAKYTAAQLKRIKARIKAAAAKFGIKISEGWLIMPAEQITESAVTEYAGDELPASTAGSFRIELTNGPVCLSLSSYCIDPADLEVIGIAAMHGAVGALKALDPDLDADIDVPSADAEDTDGDVGEAAPAAPVTEQDQHATGQETGMPEQPTDQAAGAPVTATTPAAQTAPVAAAEPTLTLGQVKDLFASFASAMAPAVPAPQLVTAGAPAEAAPAPPAQVAEATAPAANASAPTTAPAAPVTETQDQRDARIAQAAVRAYVAEQAESGTTSRKGLTVSTATSGIREAADGSILPPGVPDKPFHELTAAQWRRVRNQVGAEAAGIELPADA